MGFLQPSLQELQASRQLSDGLLSRVGNTPSSYAIYSFILILPGRYRWVHPIWNPEMSKTRQRTGPTQRHD